MTSPESGSDTRAVLVAIAEEMAATSPWHEVTMAKLAQAAGVSRQTVYNEFGNKRGVAIAVALVVARRLLAVFESAAAEEDGLEDALTAGLASALVHANASPLVKAVLTGEGGEDGLLTVVTTDSIAVLELAGGTVAELARARWPRLDSARVELAADAAIRLFVSHLLQPVADQATTAKRIAAICAAVVRDRTEPIKDGG